MALNWSEKCVLTNILRQAAKPNFDPAIPAVNPPTDATFKITDTKLYFQVVTLSTEDDNNFLEQLKGEFKRTIRWNTYRSEMTNQIQHLIKSIYCLFYCLKMKNAEHLFHSIIQQKLK